MDYVCLIGMIAGVLTTFAYFPQAIKAWQSKSVGDLSIIMLLALVTGIFLWFVYGLLIHSVPVIIANAVSFVLVSIIVLLKIIFRRREVTRTEGSR
jgi:MtN3 and saliva related transmembrane protein